MYIYILTKTDRYGDGTECDITQHGYTTLERAREEFTKLRESTIEDDWGGVYDGSEILNENYEADDYPDDYYFYIFEIGFAAGNSTEIKIVELEVEE